MLSARERKLLHGLQRRRNRLREGLFLAEGPRVVAELPGSALTPQLVVMTSTFGDSEEGAELARTLPPGVPVRVVGERVMAEVSATETPQGVIAAVRTPQTSLDDLDAAGDALFVGLDGVQDPGNVGTLVRSAFALGCAAAVVLPGSADPWGPKVVRAAAGALFRLPVVSCPVSDCVAWTEARDVTIVAADAEGTPVRGARAAGPTLLVLGNEGAGVGSELLGIAARRLAVPQREGAESLNVAAAGAILIWELLGGGGR